MDPTHLRPLPTRQALRAIRLQEIGCFVVLLTYIVAPTVLWHRWPIPLAIQAYLTGAILVLMNCLRTLASHRFLSEGREVTFVEQMLDSVTIDNDSLLAVLLNPVGLRYHATHHLFPSMPYHNLRAAHNRLLACLPADSPIARPSSALSAASSLIFGSGRCGITITAPIYRCLAVPVQTGNPRDRRERGGAEPPLPIAARQARLAEA